MLAERLAADPGKRVLVVDRRPHIGGNAYDEHDAAGMLIHRYGPHIFHTNSATCSTICRASPHGGPTSTACWRSVGDKLRADADQPHDAERALRPRSSTDEAEAAAFLAARAEPVAEIRTSEDVVVAAVGRELYETFFRGYTRKQWGLDPSELDRSVTARVPTRTITDDRYFLDTLPGDAGGGLHARCSRRCSTIPTSPSSSGVDYRDVIDRDRCATTSSSPGRSTNISTTASASCPIAACSSATRRTTCAQFQPVAVVNYPDEAVPYTRITEYKHLTGQVHPQTSITLRVPERRGRSLLSDPARRRTRRCSSATRRWPMRMPDVTFVGRLGDLSLLQHGSGRRAGAGDLSPAWRRRLAPAAAAARVSAHDPDLSSLTDSHAPSGVGEHMLTLADGLAPADDDRRRRAAPAPACSSGRARARACGQGDRPGRRARSRALARARAGPTWSTSMPASAGRGTPPSAPRAPRACRWSAPSTCPIC